MSNVPRWKVSKVEHGIGAVHLRHWKYFHTFISQELNNSLNYVFRGHRCSTWKLESTLDRLEQTSGQRPNRPKHLASFKYATRGRRGSTPPALQTENDWWALGQHHGLATPLLDWTTSPFVAAYFAFASSKHDDTPLCAVWVLSQATINRLKKQIEGTHSGDDRAPIVELFKPLSDENSRLINQGGLFSRAPDGVTIEGWLKSNMEVSYNKWACLKITMPRTDRVGVKWSPERSQG